MLLDKLHQHRGSSSPTRPCWTRFYVEGRPKADNGAVFNILATFAEFEVDLLRLRSRDGMAGARARGRLKGRQPKQQKELRRMHGTGDYTISDLAELFKGSRPTVYRTLKSQNTTPPTQ